MSYPLLVSASSIGAASETFIRRHMVDLLPGRTAVMVRTADRRGDEYWGVAGPVLALDRITHDFTDTVRRFLVEHGVKVFLGEYLDHSLKWLDLAQQLDIRFFGHAHGYDVSERLLDARLCEQYLNYRRADGLISVTQLGRAKLVEVGLDPSNIHVIPCGVDVPPEPRRRARGERVRCIAVSRMIAVKGPILTLDAFRRAVEVCPHLRLDFVGAGPLLAAARQFVHACGLTDTVTLHGAVSHDRVEELLAQADLFVQHSLRDPESGAVEGLPVAMLEAMAHGLPVVSTRHGGIPEAVSDELTGFLVEEGDSVGMARHIVALARDAELRSTQGKAGWRTASERFSWDRERRDLLEVMGLNDRSVAHLEDRSPAPREAGASLPMAQSMAVRGMSPLLVADPNPIPAEDGSGLGVTRLTWNAAGASHVEIHVDAPDGPLLCRGGSSGSGATGRWVRNGMVFYLQDVSRGQPLTLDHTLEALTVYVLKPPAA